jgi:hypothetical protein
MHVRVTLGGYYPKNSSAMPMDPVSSCIQFLPCMSYPCRMLNQTPRNQFILSSKTNWTNKIAAWPLSCLFIRPARIKVTPAFRGSRESYQKRTKYLTKRHRCLPRKSFASTLMQGDIHPEMCPESLGITRYPELLLRV